MTKEAPSALDASEDRVRLEMISDALRLNAFGDAFNSAQKLNDQDLRVATSLQVVRTACSTLVMIKYYTGDKSSLINLVRKKREKQSKSPPSFASIQTHKIISFGGRLMNIPDNWIKHSLILRQKLGERPNCNLLFNQS